MTICRIRTSVSKVFLLIPALFLILVASLLIVPLPKHHFKCKNLCSNSLFSLRNGKNLGTVSKTDVTNIARFHTFGIVQTPSVYTILKGGLGNQLFEFACAYALARKYSLPLYIKYEEPKMNYTFRSLERRQIAKYFHLPLHKWNTVTKSWKFSKAPVKLRDFDILSDKIPENAILQPIDGCQTQKFFEPYQKEMWEMFKLRTDMVDTASTGMLEQLDNLKSFFPSVCVHIRRGDFSSTNRVPASFYHESMEILRKKLHPAQPTFFVFSDETNITELQTEFGSDFFTSNYTRLVSNGRFNSLQEFYLLTKCDHAIIPNSSYAWWASYLNESRDKIVIAAYHNSKWVYDYHKSSTGHAKFYVFFFKYLYYPAEWFVFDPFNSTNYWLS